MEPKGDKIPGAATGTGATIISRILSHADILMALGVIWIVGTMVIPIPAGLLDILLSFSITFSLVVLLVTLYTTEPLQFSVFPGLLLILTLFRLSLNVASTRLILLHADAGKVIQAFGSFVVGGNYVVGMVIFLTERENSTVHLCPSCDSHLPSRYGAVVSSPIVRVLLGHGVPVQDAHGGAVGNLQAVLLDPDEELLMVVCLEPPVPAPKSLERSRVCHEELGHDVADQVAVVPAVTPTGKDQVPVLLLDRPEVRLASMLDAEELLLASQTVAGGNRGLSLYHDFKQSFDSRLAGELEVVIEGQEERCGNVLQKGISPRTDP